VLGQELAFLPHSMSGCDYRVVDAASFDSVPTAVFEVHMVRKWLFSYHTPIVRLVDSTTAVSSNYNDF
jgi:hypothetical protein